MTKSEILNYIKFKTTSSDTLVFIDASLVKKQNTKTEKKLINLLCALINSNCKKVIFGIKTKNNRAQQFDFIEYSENVILYLKTIIETNLFPQQAVEVNFIEIEQNKGVVLINLINTTKPCMSFDGRYYTLKSNKPTVMKEYEIRTLYLLSTRPILEIVGIINTQGIPIYDNGTLINICFYPKILIKNSGTAPEKIYKIEIKIPSLIHDTNNSPLQNYFTRIEGKYSVFTIVGKHPIFQDEIYTICEAKLSIDEKNINTFLTESIEITIFYSQQKVKYTYLLNEIFSFNKLPLHEKLFLKP